MTNYEFLRTCSQEDMAELITTILVESFEALLAKPIPEEQIDAEIIEMYDWLSTDVIDSTLLN